MSSSELLERHNQSFKKKFLELNFSSKHRKKIFFIRITIITALISLIAYDTITAWNIHPTISNCIYDRIFDLTAPINDFFNNNKEPRNAILIFSSFLIDVLLLWFSIRYALLGRSSRQLIFFMLFYLSRSVVQSFFLMKMPQGNCWDYPGFPSLTVSYEKTSDFFYSGHVGVVLFCGLENKHLGNLYMMWVSFFVCGIEFCVMIAMRGHYSIDLIFGLIFSHYSWIVSEWVAEAIDKKLRIGKYL